MSESASAVSVFALPDFRRLLVANACATLASRGLAVVVGYQVYELTKSPFSLAWLGLFEAIPALSLALYGGHVADRHDRRTILRLTQGISFICAASVVAVAANRPLPLALLYAVVFVAGIARGFADPAISAFEAQIVPRDQMVRASAWISTVWLSCAIIGPLLGTAVLQHFGWIADWLLGTKLPATAGVTATYGLFAALFAAGWINVSALGKYPVARPPEGESIWQSIVLGVKFVASDQVLLGSMALDLFAVLFGGAVAILPIFARDILRVDAIGLGLLNAAPNIGALCTMLLATRRPPIRHAGRNLLVAVGGFGVSMIVFALSQNLWLSLAALFVAGMCDGISVVVRRSVVRLLSPPHLRGRVASVGMVFIGASNEIGAFESGLAAGWLGTVRSVWAGGLVTLLIVAFTAAAAPRLRTLRLDASLPEAEEERGNGTEGSKGSEGSEGK